MLTKFRRKHSKKVLWGLTIVIVIAFGLGGGVSLMKGRKKAVTAAILGGKKLTTSDIDYYKKMAKVFLAFNTAEDKNIDPLSVERLASEFLILIWKAKQEKIKVSDKEVARYVVKNIFGVRKFEKHRYENFFKFLSRRHGLTLSYRGYE